MRNRVADLCFLFLQKNAIAVAHVKRGKGILKVSIVSSFGSYLVEPLRACFVRAACNGNGVLMSRCTQMSVCVQINGNPLELLQPETLRYKIFEPVLLVSCRPAACSMTHQTSG